MPDKVYQVLMNRPQMRGPVNLPQGDPNAPEAQVLRFGSGMLGNQKPGDLPSFLGAMAGMGLPFLSKLKSLRGAAAASEAIPELTPGFRANMHEFAPVAEARPPLTVEEANKMMQLMKPNPAMVGGPGNVSTFAPERFGTATNAKLAEQKAALDAYRRAAAATRGE